MIEQTGNQAETGSTSAEIRRLFELANEHRDYSIYTRLMDAALEAKVKALSSYFPSISHGDRIVDAGSGTGKPLEELAKIFRGAKCYALDMSQELLDIADENRALINLVHGNAIEQNFPDNSIKVKYYSTSGHEIESFGGQGSMTEAIKNTFRELEPGGRLIVRDFAKPELESPVFMKILSNVGLDQLPAGTSEEEIDYSLLSTRALFDCFHQQFNNGSAFDYRIIEPDGLIELEPEWAHEFYLRKDYTANWRQEIKEKYTYWTPSQAKKILEEAGYVNVQVIPDPNEWMDEDG